jgi:hypothetical protein
MAIIALGELPRTAAAIFDALRRRFAAAYAPIGRRLRRSESADAARTVLRRDGFSIDERPFRTPYRRPEPSAHDIGRQLR